MNDIEKILEANGPIVEAMSRSMEPPIMQLGRMVKYDVLQYYTTAKVMADVGADNVTLDTFDFEPESLVPSHLPGEDVDKPSPTEKLDRARILADNLEFQVLPGTLHEITQMAMKLGLIQLRKANVKISSETIARAWQVPNYGSFDGSTELEKWENEQERDLWFAARMKQELEAAGFGGPAGPGAGGKKQEGRPPSGQAAPQLVSKDAGARSTIKESR